MRKLIVVAAMMVVASATVQAGQSRSLSLAGSDKAVQDTKVAEQASAVETQRRPLPPKAADASGATGATQSSSVNEKPKYMDRPPGIDMSRQEPHEGCRHEPASRAAAYGGHGDAPSAAQALVRRAHRRDAAPVWDLLVSGGRSPRGERSDLF